MITREFFFCIIGAAAKPGIWRTLLNPPSARLTDLSANCGFLCWPYEIRSRKHEGRQAVPKRRKLSALMFSNWTRSVLILLGPGARRGVIPETRKDDSPGPRERPHRSPRP